MVIAQPALQLDVYDLLLALIPPTQKSGSLPTSAVFAAVILAYSPNMLSCGDEPRIVKPSASASILTVE